MFQAEIEFLTKVQHPGVVRLLDCFDNEVERGIILEYCNAATLRVWIDSECSKTDQLEVKLKFLRDLAEVMDYLTSFSEVEVVHRDL